jgi:hypothetical protein
LNLFYWFILHGYYIFMFTLILSLDYLNGSQTIWDKHFSCHLGKTNLTTHISLQLNTSRIFSFLIWFQWCKKLWELYGKLMIYVKTLVKHIRKQPNLPWSWKNVVTKSIWNKKRKKMLFVVQGLKGSEQVPYFHVYNF